MQGIIKKVCCLRGAVQWYPAGLDHLPSSCVALQSVRWRKSRMTPPNKNKEFIIAEHKNHYTLGESDEMFRLNMKYDTAIKCTRLYLKELYDKQSDTSEAAMLEAQDEEQQHLAMMEYNTRENERMAAIREERVKHELNERLEQIIISKMKLQAREENERTEALALLQQTEEFVKTFIHPEDFFKALEEAYDNPVDFNFAIDIQGYMYPGHSTKPWQIEDKPRLDDPNQATIGAVCKQRN